MQVHSHEKMDDTFIHELQSTADFYKGQPISLNADYGFNQLAEVAIKALSPGINDPATAVLSLHSLSDLFSFRLHHKVPALRFDESGQVRIFLPSSSFTDMIEKCIHPIWNYGKQDQYIRDELLLMTRQLKVFDSANLYTEVFEKIIQDVEEQKHVQKGQA